MPGDVLHIVGCSMRNDIGGRATCATLPGTWPCPVIIGQAAVHPGESDERAALHIPGTGCTDCVSERPKAYQVLLLLLRLD
jgi:hypothetical protein